MLKLLADKYLPHAVANIRDIRVVHFYINQF